MYVPFGRLFNVDFVSDANILSDVSWAERGWNISSSLLLRCLLNLLNSRNFFYRKSTIKTTIAGIEANDATYRLQKRTEKFPLSFEKFLFSWNLCSTSSGTSAQLILEFLVPLFWNLSTLSMQPSSGYMLSPNQDHCCLWLHRAIWNVKLWSEWLKTVDFAAGK